MPTELTRRRFRWKNLCVKLWKWNERPTNSSVEGAAYCLKKKLCGKTLIKQDRFTQNQKKNKDLWCQVKKHIFYVSSLALSMRQPLSFKVVKNKPQIEKDPVCRGIRKDPKMKKKTISVTVTYLLISKTGSSESRSELSSMAELTIVQEECASVTWRAFSIPGSFFGNQGDLRGEREISEATHANFFRAVHPFFGLFCLVFFNFFLCFFFKNKKLPQELNIRVFFPMMDIKLLFIIGI